MDLHRGRLPFGERINRPYKSPYSEPTSSFAGRRDRRGDGSARIIDDGDERSAMDDVSRDSTLTDDRADNNGRDGVRD